MPRAPHQPFPDERAITARPVSTSGHASEPSGDNPPRPECAPLWHERLLNELAEDRLEIIIGNDAQRRYITNRKKNLTDTANWAAYLPTQVVLPHPSPRNQHWLTKNQWFETETLPAVQRRIAEFLKPDAKDS